MKSRKSTFSQSRNPSVSRFNDYPSIFCRNSLFSHARDDTPNISKILVDLYSFPIMPISYYCSGLCIERPKT